MRRLLSLGLLSGFLAVTPPPALAEGAVAVVVPNRPDVPVIINGVDASWAVVEGDWGLARGIRAQPTVYGGRYVDPEPHVGHYYPRNGTAPGYGRLEIEPPARNPRRAESYHRSWTAQSVPPRAPDVAAGPPLVVQVPYGGQGNADPQMHRRR